MGCCVWWVSRPLEGWVGIEGRESEAVRAGFRLAGRTMCGGQQGEHWRAHERAAGSSIEATACAAQLNSHVCREFTESVAFALTTVPAAQDLGLGIQSKFSPGREHQAHLCPSSSETVFACVQPSATFLTARATCHHLARFSDSRRARLGIWARMGSWRSVKWTDGRMAAWGGRVQMLTDARMGWVSGLLRASQGLHRRRVHPKEPPSFPRAGQPGPPGASTESPG